MRSFSFKTLLTSVAVMFGLAFAGNAAAFGITYGGGYGYAGYGYAGYGGGYGYAGYGGGYGYAGYGGGYGYGGYGGGGYGYGGGRNYYQEYKQQNRKANRLQNELNSATTQRDKYLAQRDDYISRLDSIKANGGGATKVADATGYSGNNVSNYKSAGWEEIRYRVGNYGFQGGSQTRNCWSGWDRLDRFKEQAGDYAMDTRYVTVCGKR